MTNIEQVRITYRQLLSFFIPLGISAALVTISHVIINSTLARSAHPEFIIASYALPMSILGITERPAVLLRQTCSALVRDRVSFRAMSLVSMYVLGAIFVLGGLISYTPLGSWVFTHLFGASPEMVAPMVQVYRVLMFVSIFSGIRCVYHGIIIFNMRTKWLTIGMLIRLIGMYALSVYFIRTGVTSGAVGAIIFLSGMIIEAAVSLWEGGGLVRKTMPEKKPDHPIERPGQIFSFYKPLLYSSVIAVIAGPSINAFLGKTADISLSIASFAIAASLAQLVQSFFSYIHQIVLNFYRKDAQRVVRFTMMMSLVPSLLIAVLAYTPAGPFFMQHVMGVNDRLLHASLLTLRVFMLMNFIFPWLDFGNGLLMLRGQTKVMVWSQAGNVSVTLVTLSVCIMLAPGWNAMIGALAQSLGMGAELAVVLYTLRQTANAEGRLSTFSPFRNSRKSNESSESL
ncbi:multi antimicrobial extrusion protein MatE [Paenibacillus filicis]|uniref:Multi antimicrobial extrusion protein MatE n=1 Tax=Paenibacillus gyeongsangnamensis TaxID=3388067 RepID=A0ABT4Q5A6_9BACL|nr:multi antimicrobial extrusion protein MatE [Paenibacillus filicis]MCZ8512064.1 multi antimicrobial extrusion protein MatE [Paenibacillus filicis]